MLSCTPQVLHASEVAPSSGQQVEDQDNHRYHQQEVNQAAGNMKAEAQEPQNQNDDKNCPEHRYPFPAWRAPESW